jgi:hypothetical protein
MIMAGPPFAAGENNQDLVVEEPRLFPQPRFLPPDDRQRNIKTRERRSLTAFHRCRWCSRIAKTM